MLSFIKLMQIFQFFYLTLYLKLHTNLYDANAENNVKLREAFFQE